MFRLRKDKNASDYLLINLLMLKYSGVDVTSHVQEVRTCPGLAVGQDLLESLLQFVCSLPLQMQLPLQILQLRTHTEKWTGIYFLIIIFHAWPLLNYSAKPILFLSSLFKLLLFECPLIRLSVAPHSKPIG